MKPNKAAFFSKARIHAFGGGQLAQGAGNRPHQTILEIGIVTEAHRCVNKEISRLRRYNRNGMQPLPGYSK